MLATRAFRPLASLTTRRPLSQLVVSVVGPDRGGLVSSVTRAIAAHDGNVVESSSFSIGPVFSMAMLVEAGADQHAALTSAVQSAVPGHSVSAHEAEECVEYTGCDAPVRYCLYGAAAGHGVPGYYSEAVVDWFRSF